MALPLMRISNPIKSSAMMIGANHHFLLWHKKSQNSARMPGDLPSERARNSVGFSSDEGCSESFGSAMIFARNLMLLDSVRFKRKLKLPKVVCFLADDFFRFPVRFRLWVETPAEQIMAREA